MTKRIFILFAVLVLLLQTSIIPAFGEVSEGKPVKPPVLKSESAIVVEQNSGKILFAKDARKRVHPASLTKNLTALLVLENLSPDETVTVGKEIELIGHDASEAGLNAGTKLSVSNLMWALMLPSGNDAAYTAAVAVAVKKSGNPALGIREAVKYFVDLMNVRAQEIGAKESNFINPDGYPDKNHYSTAYDLALITRESMKKEFFREVAGTYAYTVKEGTPRIWYNKNQLINSKSKYFYPYATGIKTGFTSDAGFCLAASAVKDNLSLVSIVMKAAKEEQRWLDSRALLEYGFANFSYHAVLQKDEVVSTVSVGRRYAGGETSLNVVADQAHTDLLSQEEIAAVKREIVWDPRLILSSAKAGQVRVAGPVMKGQVLGKISCTLNGTVLVEARLLASQDALRDGFSDKILNTLDLIAANRIPVVIGTVLFVAVLLAVISGLKGKKRKE